MPHIGMEGSLVNINALEGEGVLIQKGALIGKRALNQIITVVRHFYCY